MNHKTHVVTCCAAVITFCVIIAPVIHAQETITPTFAGSYSLKNIGSPSGVPTPLGPLTFLNDNTLLVGGSADTSSGAIYSIGVTRDSSNHITGFNGTAVLFSTAPQIDGAMEFGPGGVLFFTGFPTNTMGEIKPGSSAPDKTVDLTAAGISSSVGGLEFAPNSDLKIVSYNSNGFYKAVLAADGSGTYNVSSTTLALTLTSASGPEGMIYVPVGSPVFIGPSMLLTDFGSGKISAYQVDSFDNPIDSSAQDFITGLTGALGATIDPLTNDFVFSTFGGGDHIDVVGGFAPTLPSVTLSPASLSFAGQLVGTTSSSKAVTLTNTGNGALSVTSVVPSGDFAESNNCTGGPVVPGNHCMISVTATPSVAGSIPGEVTIADNAADSPQRVNLSGLGLTPLSATPATLAFGTVAVGSSSAKTVTLTNNQPSTPLSLSFSTSGDFTATGGGTTPCGSSLNGTKKCTMTVTFSPKYNGAVSGALSVSYGSGTQDIALSGTGSTGGTAPLTFSPVSLSFTNVLVGATSPGKTVTITNGGGTPVNISGIGPSGNYAATGSGARPCGGPLASAASCSISVTFSPTQAGTAAGAITIADDAAISPQDYKVTGTAVLPVTLVPASLTFPSQSVGTSSAALKVTLTNNQNVTLNISGTVPSGDYAITSIGTTPCGSSVPALGKCTFGVIFAPTSAGTIKGVVTVSTDANGSPQEVKMTGIAH